MYKILVQSFDGDEEIDARILPGDDLPADNRARLHQYLSALLDDRRVKYVVIEKGFDREYNGTMDAINERDDHGFDRARDATGKHSVGD